MSARASASCSGCCVSSSGTPEAGALAVAADGWRFGPYSPCLPVRSTAAAPRCRFAAPARAVCESGGFVWVFSGFDLPDDESAAEPNHHPSLDDESLTRHDHWEEWDCHWTRAMENMLDFPHLPYIHRTTIGRFVSRKMHRHSRLNLQVTDTAYGFALESRVDDHPPSAALRWYRPHGMVLDTMPEGDSKTMRLHVFCVPVDELRTRMFLTSQRSFAGNPAASIGINRFNLTVLHQDREVVESSMPPHVPEGGRDGVERSVPSDKPTLAFRTWYHRTLRDSRVADPRVASSTCSDSHTPSSAPAWRTWPTSATPARIGRATMFAGRQASLPCEASSFRKCSSRATRAIRPRSSS